MAKARIIQGCPADDKRIDLEIKVKLEQCHPYEHPTKETFLCKNIFYFINGVPVCKFAKKVDNHYEIRFCESFLDQKSRALRYEFANSQGQWYHHPREALGPQIPERSDVIPPLRLAPHYIRTKK
jgi:hypothetical protein